MFYKLALVCPVMALTACGGSSTNSNVLPFSASGFATAADANSSTADFTVADVRLVSESRFNELEFTTRDVSVVGNFSADDLTVEIDGTSYTLTRSNTTLPFFTFAEGADSVRLDGYLESAYVSGLELSMTLDGVTERGGLVVGYDTDPATISGRSNTATYQGTLLATLSNNGDIAFGSGAFQLTANFSKEEIGGTAVILDDNFSIAEFTFNPVFFILNTTDISGNGFEGAISSNDPDLGGTLSEAIYSGRFFGPQAEDIGGQMTGRIDLDDSTNDTLVEAFFVGEQPDD